jgi:site-specific DNA-methyltransferase (adenine-specific)
VKPYYEEDGITIYHGDCRDILWLLPKVDFVLTDPPYGIEGTWNGGRSHGWGRHSGEAAKWDQRVEWLASMVSYHQTPSIIWGGQYYALPPSGSWLVWDKKVRNFTGGHCELAWTNLGMPVRAFSFSNGELATEGKDHPTQKPLALFKWCMEFVPTAQTTLDPFMGSGTTLRAAKDLGRKAIGIEIEERYCEIAAKRLAQGVLPLPSPLPPITERKHYQELDDEKGFAF